MNRPGQGPVGSSPPVDFPVYGLEPAWPGSRWLESFGDQIGDPVSWVSLGHQSLGGESTVLIETFSRPRVDLVCGGLPLEHVAGYACTALINITLPEHSEPWPGDFLRALNHLSEKRSEQCARWRLIRWQVNGVAVPARAWRFAGGWAVVSDAVESVYLAAAGMGTEPDALRLAVLPDDDTHHFGLDQPLHPDILSASVAREGGDERRYLRPAQFHPDQLRLMRNPRSGAPAAGA